MSHVSLSNHSGQAFTHILRQAQDDPALIIKCHDELIEPLVHYAFTHVLRQAQRLFDFTLTLIMSICRNFMQILYTYES